MPVETKNKESYSDYWLNHNEIDDLISSSEKNTIIGNKIDLLKLSSAKRAISSFVTILTGKNIPVIFNSSDLNATDNKKIYLSTKVISKKDFDVACGLSCHESMHIIKTDFGLIQLLWQKIPSELYKLGQEKGLDNDAIIVFVKMVFNWVEDRYIDYEAYRTAPGYRGYYLEMYKKYFFSNIITKHLKSNVLRTPTLNSYEYRLINLMNKNSDYDALPGLRKIVEIINLPNIKRLTSCNQRLQVAFEIVKIVFENIKSPKKKNNKNTVDKISKMLNPSGNITKDGEGENEGEPDDVLGGVNSEADKAESKDDLDVEEGENDTEDLGEEDSESGDENSDGDEEDVSGILDKINKQLEKQKDFIDGRIKKGKVSAQENKLLTIIEKSGIVISSAGADIPRGEFKNRKIDCIVVNNMTRDLIISDLFPMRGTVKSYCGGEISPVSFTKEAVEKGISMGTILGKKLQIRSEINSTKFPRRFSGKIDRRTIAGIGAGLEDIFYNIKVDKFNSVNLHISVDASSSMAGEKWIKTMSLVVSICKAASMVNNINVKVSFRTTCKCGEMELPYIVLAYDSTKDKFDKIKQLFPYLGPSGCTPEGLAYEATMKHFVKNNSGDNDYYLLNISDGEPCYAFSRDTQMSIFYAHEPAVQHTKTQVNKIRASGVKVMAYYISSPIVSSDLNLQQFKTMYGRDSRIINVSNVNEIAKTLNELFLSKS
jgi:hypothetical protein